MLGGGEMTGLPFLLKPIGKDYLWGGNRLNDDFAKNIDLVPLAETWECSTHPEGLSLVASGENKGLTLKEVIKRHPEYMGKIVSQDGELPILIKFIDAREKLSVQVHPSDEYAFKYENGQRGKTEMWYVLDAAKGARLIYGFNKDISKERIKKSIERGTIEKNLQSIPVKRNDVFFIEAGMVHAIGEGILLAEIQENSNLTYRLYDYNRIDKVGNRRELQIERALDVVNMKGAEPPKQPMRVLKYKPGCALELLCRCKYFQVERLLINTERIRNMAELEVRKDTFQVLLCIGGCGTLFVGTEGTISFFEGDCIFVPADCEQSIRIHGKATMLKVSC